MTGVRFPSNSILLTDVTCDERLNEFLLSNGSKIVEKLSLGNIDDKEIHLSEIGQQLKTVLRNNYCDGIVIISQRKNLSSPFKNLLNTIGLPIIVLLNANDDKLQKLTGLVRRYDKYHFSAIKLSIKRLFDIVGALVGVPIMLIVALFIFPIVQKQSQGPLFFKQKRVGKNGKVFEMYKFRSMYLDADERKKELIEHNSLNTDLMFKMDNDPRIFPFGQKIRNWSLDELPQFINVLKGDMSLVGTRPPTVDEYRKYELHHFKRLAIKPGITGMWQVSGRSNISNFEDVVALDESYIQNWSLLLDVKLIIKTILVVVMRHGSK